MPRLLIQPDGARQDPALEPRIRRAEADDQGPVTASPSASARLPWFSLRGLPAFVIVIVAVVPFWLIPLAHLASDSETATGFFHEELPYYVANGRAAWDRGNGILYPNPYDPDPAAPAIYAHWLLWILGFLPACLGADPGQVMLLATFCSSLIFSLTTWWLVRHRSITPLRSHTAFLAAMWGGGLLALTGGIAGLAGFTNPESTILQFDPGRGLWFLNWGRNATFATESVYHALVAACWLSELRSRRLMGTLFCAALASTHPWSGLELLLTLNLWRAVQWLQLRNRSATGWLLLSVAMLAVFLGYYKVWLPGFPQHAQLQQVWQLNWNLPTSSALLAYALVGSFAIWRLTTRVRAGQADTINGTHASLRPDEPLSGGCVASASPESALAVSDRRTSGERAATGTSSNEPFLWCALIVAVALAFHDRLIQPVQPLHFTRGYVWMPLFLLGLPAMQVWWKRQTGNGLRGRLMVSGFALLLCADNVAFVVIHCHSQWTQTRGYHLNLHDRALLQDLHRRSPDAIVLTESTTLNYLMPAYARVRPWLGHPFNTPDYPRRSRAMAQALPPGRIVPRHLAADIDVLAVSRERNTAALQQSGRWIELESPNARWQLWGRIGSDGSRAPLAARE